MNEIQQLRELLNLTSGKTYVTESSGLAARSVGDEFVSDDGLPTLHWQDVMYFPDCNGDCSYETSEEMLGVIDQVEQEHGEIEWINKRGSNSLAFIVIMFIDENKKEKNFGRFFKKNVSNRSHQFPDNKMPGYKLNSKAGKKEASGMKPTEILTKFDNLSSDDVVNEVANKFGKDHILTVLTRSIADGQTFPISFDAPAGIEFTAFHDYFCEILHPLALQNGTTTGNADDAEEMYFPTTGFKDTSISYGETATTGLSDSILFGNNGQELKISSKGKGNGASASVKGIKSAISQLRNPKLERKYSNTIQLIETITSNSGKTAPLELAVQFGMITSAEKDKVNDFAKWTSEGATYYDFLKGGKYRDKITRRLQKFYDDRVPRNMDKANAWPHMIASIAYPVAEYVNTNKKINFSESVATILNNSALITIKTRGTKRGDTWVLNMFKSEFPSKATTDVILSAAKEYMSTTSRGGYVFEILFNGASPKAILDKEHREAKGGSEPEVLITHLSKTDKKSIAKKKVQQIKRSDFNKDSSDTEMYGREKSTRSKGRDSYDNWFNDQHPPGSF